MYVTLPISLCDILAPLVWIFKIKYKLEILNFFVLFKSISIKGVIIENLKYFNLTIQLL